MSPASPPPPEEVTALLAAARDGDRAARDRLFALVYDELKRIARRQLAGTGLDGTLATTALVHEAYLRLAGPAAGPGFKDRVHFFAVAARAMRQILIDHVRSRQAAKRGGGAVLVELDTGWMGEQPSTDAAELLALDEALTRLERLSPRLGQVVELRFFGGLTFPEIGEAMALSDRTVERDWRKARAFLYAELGGQLSAPG